MTLIAKDFEQNVWWKSLRQICFTETSGNSNSDKNSWSVWLTKDKQHKRVVSLELAYLRVL